MLTRLTLAGLFTLLSAAGVSAQPWRDAYQAGDYRTAAALLHPLVMDHPPEQLYGDAGATEHLASMYAQGLGVPADAVLACALFDFARRADMAQGPIPHDFDGLREQQARRAHLDEQRASHCGRLTEPQQAEAFGLLGCFTADFPSQHFEIGVGRTVDVTRRGIMVRNGNEESLLRLNVLGNCPADVALVRYTRAEASNASAAPRHFLEVFAWTRVWRQGQAGRALVWSLWEVMGSHALPRAMETLVDSGAPTWPTPPLSFALADVALNMAPSGDVTWRFGAGGNRQGALKAPPRRRAVRSTPPSAGTGSVQIHVVDPTGAPNQGATVTLAGWATRDGTTDEHGVVLFDALPEGRYDLIVSASQQVMFPSQFVDVSRGPVPPVEVALKRAGKFGAALACGFLIAPPTTLRAFMETDVEAVLHVKVQDQHAFEVPDGDGPARIMTMNTVAVLHAFKGAGQRGGGGTLNVLQVGGGLERGGSVDQYRLNHLTPLSVGDEYVLFLTHQADGAMTIHFGEDGAFRLRNGLVEPLGTGVIAAEWNAAASEFLAELTAISAGRAH